MFLSHNFLFFLTVPPSEAYSIYIYHLPKSSAFFFKSLLKFCQLCTEAIHYSNPCVKNLCFIILKSFFRNLNSSSIFFLYQLSSPARGLLLLKKCCREKLDRMRKTEKLLKFVLMVRRFDEFCVSESLIMVFMLKVKARDIGATLTFFSKLDITNNGRT